MSTIPHSHVSGDSGASTEAVDAFQNVIEDRYSEWEREFGDEIEARRTLSFDPKK
jgi:hypothetical protein